MFSGKCGGGNPEFSGDFDVHTYKPRIYGDKAVKAEPNEYPWVVITFYFCLFFQMIYSNMSI